ncbi:MAG: hypothetical protein ACD_21C00329G0003 [uncultured bacterium]|nr:MAG: hypothetical protein ACD_21C00329G0003 [uncultured bacterium]
MWFRKYDIKVVPALVVSSDGEESDSQNTQSKKKERNERSEKNAGNEKYKKNKKDVVYGNIPLKRALTIVAEEGSAAKVAKAILSRSRVR